MIKNLILCLVLLLAQSVFARTMKINLETTWKKDNVTRTMKKELVVKLGKKWIIPIDKNNDLRVEMLVQDQTKKNKPSNILSFKSKVYKKDKNKLELISSPKIMALINQEAIMTVREEDGSTLEIKVVAQEK